MKSTLIFNENIETDMALFKLRLEKSYSKVINKSTKKIKKEIRSWDKANRLHLLQNL